MSVGTKAWFIRLMMDRGPIIDGTKIRQFRTEYAKSDKSKCRICFSYIDQYEVRISRIDEERGIDRWHHVHCFSWEARDLDFHTRAENLQGFEFLSPYDQMMLIEELDYRCERSDMESDESNVEEEGGEEEEGEEEEEGVEEDIDEDDNEHDLENSGHSEESTQPEENSEALITIDDGVRMVLFNDGQNITDRVNDMNDNKGNRAVFFEEVKCAGSAERYFQRKNQGSGTVVGVADSSKEGIGRTDNMDATSNNEGTGEFRDLTGITIELNGQIEGLSDDVSQQGRQHHESLAGIVKEETALASTTTTKQEPGQSEGCAGASRRSQPGFAVETASPEYNAYSEPIVAQYIELHSYAIPARPVCDSVQSTHNIEGNDHTYAKRRRYGF